MTDGSNCSFCKLNSGSRQAELESPDNRSRACKLDPFCEVKRFSEEKRKRHFDRVIHYKVGVQSPPFQLNIMTPNIDLWKQIAGILARAKNSDRLILVPAQFHYIRQRFPDVYALFNQQFMYASDIYPLLSQIGRKYEIYLKDKAEINGTPVDMQYTEESAEEFEHSF